MNTQSQIHAPPALSTNPSHLPAPSPSTLDDGSARREAVRRATLTIFKLQTVFSTLGSLLDEASLVLADLTIAIPAPVMESSSSQSPALSTSSASHVPNAESPSDLQSSFMPTNSELPSTGLVTAVAPTDSPSGDRFVLEGNHPIFKYITQEGEREALEAAKLDLQSWGFEVTIKPLPSCPPCVWVDDPNGGSHCSQCGFISPF